MNLHNTSWDDDDIQFAYDATSLNVADQCLRKYQLEVREGWQPKEINPHLFFGKLYATAEEHFHKHRADSMSHNDALREVVREALIESWIDGAPWISTHNAKTRENLIRTIIWYADHFEDDPTEVVKLSNGKPAVELSFSFEIDYGLILCGHLDRLCTYAGRIHIMDQKTTGHTITPRYFEQFQNDMQMGLYAFAGKAVYNLPIAGVIIDAAQIAVGFTRFERGFIFKSDQVLDEWYTDALLLIEQIREATRENYFPMRRASCQNYGGCPFLPVCSRPPEVRAQFLKADFKQREKLWDPLERR